MSIQRGTPTVIKMARMGDRMSIVITVSTPSAFTAHHHVYEVGYAGTGNLIETFGCWAEECGAKNSHERWVEDNSPHIE